MSQKQFPDIVDQAMEAIAAIAAQSPGHPARAYGDFTRAEIEAGLRETFGNADAIYFAAEEAFRAGHDSCLKVTVPALFQDPTHKPNVCVLWEAYDPSEAVKTAVQEMA